MNTDTTTNDNLHVSWDDSTDDRIRNTVQIAHNPSVCKNAFCYRTSALGSDYCDRHGPDADPLGGITDPSPVNPQIDRVSRRDLQRQLDRIEGKLDALLNGGDSD